MLYRTATYLSYPLWHRQTLLEAASFKNYNTKKKKRKKEWRKENIATIKKWKQTRRQRSCFAAYYAQRGGLCCVVSSLARLRDSNKHMVMMACIYCAPFSQLKLSYSRHNVALLCAFRPNTCEAWFFWWHCHTDKIFLFFLLGFSLYWISVTQNIAPKDVMNYLEYLTPPFLCLAYHPPQWKS